MKRSYRFILILYFIFAGVFFSHAQEQEKQLKTWEIAEKEADRLEGLLKLEVWQVFYVDSTLKHDYEEMKNELEKLQQAKVSNPSLYIAIQDKWIDQIETTYKRIFNEEQWKVYLKSGAGKQQKQREKRKAKVEKQNKK